MHAINGFLLRNDLRISRNPCISPDFCLDWAGLRTRLRSGKSVHGHPRSRFRTGAGSWTLMEDSVTGDCAWHLAGAHGAGGTKVLEDGLGLADGSVAFPATWDNLLRLKNLVQEHDPNSTIFPTAGANLGRGTIGVGARFTTLHWPAVEWVMSALGIGMTANQNSIPRELVYDTEAMLSGRLDRVPFPFLGAEVPEGHQGQSVEGMSHGAVLSKLRTGFHRRGIEWSFNADHQPVGGHFDAREDRLVEGCLLASYITFDLSPELALKRPASPGDIDRGVVESVRDRLKEAGLALSREALGSLLCMLWPAMKKMRIRDEKYRAAREKAFTTEKGCQYLREISIDELPGVTPPETTGVILAMAEALAITVNFVAPSFGFRKNLPFENNRELKRLIERQWAVCRKFGVGIGFHSGSGKSAENYRVMGAVTKGCLEIKTSGRYTYEMGVALHGSRKPDDRKLWRDWYQFTLELAVRGSFSEDTVERTTARGFVEESAGSRYAPETLFASPDRCRRSLMSLRETPEHVFFREYNFLYVLAAGGAPDKNCLGDHSPDGYRQRARFYAVSPEARLRYARGVAGYLIFLAESTGLAPTRICRAARRRLDRYRSLNSLVDDIPRMQ